MSSSRNLSGHGERGTYTAIAQAADMTGAQGETAHDEDHIVGDLEAPIHIGSVPTAEDLLFLPRVSDTLPHGAFLIAIVELCERFAYYGLSGPFQNYIANGHNDTNGLPGALGFGQTGATAMTNMFQFWCYCTPLLGAIIADQYLGKYATIKWFSLVYMVGIVVLFVSSLPWSIQNGAAFPGLIVAMAIIGFGTGGIKSNVSPMIAEQALSTKPFVKTFNNGKQVLVDPGLTVQRIFMVFYTCINLGSISAIATTMLELHVGFWSAYLLPLVMFCVGYGILVRGKNSYIIKSPQGGVIGNCFRALWIGIVNGGNLNKARPSMQEPGLDRVKITWDDNFVTELQTALVACKVFLFFPIFWLTFSQMTNNFVSQAGQMNLHGLPNDILFNLDPIAIILLIPLMDRIIYPFIRTRLHLAFTPTTRVTLGFLIAALAMLYAGVLQSVIYAAPPCFARPLKCEAGKLREGKFRPNEVHIAWQAPAYILIAISEILASITGLELAYAKAPENMKSFIMSLYLLTSAGGSALGILIAPLAKDPYLPWLYFGLAIAAALTGFGFYRVFRDLDNGVQAVSKTVSMPEEIEMISQRSRDDDGYYSGDDNYPEHARML